MKKLLLIVGFGCLSLFSSEVRAEEPVFVPGVNWRTQTGPFIKRSGPNMYDYQATALKDETGRWQIWDCGKDPAGPRDSITYSRFDTTGAMGVLPKTVMTANYQADNSWDNLHACSPTVIKHSTVLSRKGLNQQDVYLMYYECNANFYNRCDGSQRSINDGKISCDTAGNNCGVINCDPNFKDGVFTQVCLAASYDGETWMKYNKYVGGFGNTATFATPLIKAADLVYQNCGFVEEDNKFKLYLKNDNCIYQRKPGEDQATYYGNLYGKAMVNYGVGQPSVMTMRLADGSQEVWLYYGDSGGDYSKKGIYLAKSKDGINFGTPIKTNLTTGPGPVRYYPHPVGIFTNGVYFMGFTIEDQNYFGYSGDGVNWVFPDYNRAWHENGRDGAKALESLKSFALGMVMDNTCPLPGKWGMLGDKNGYLTMLKDIVILSGEGKTSRKDIYNWQKCYDDVEVNNPLSTWGIYVMDIKFNYVGPTNTPTLPPSPPPTNTPIAIPPTNTPTAVPPTNTPTDVPTNTLIPTQVKVPGDANGDGQVGLSDFVVWRREYLGAVSTKNADFDKDGRVNLADFVIWRREYLK